MQSTRIKIFLLISDNLVFKLIVTNNGVKNTACFMWKDTVLHEPIFIVFHTQITNLEEKKMIEYYLFLSLIIALESLDQLLNAEENFIEIVFYFNRKIPMFNNKNMIFICI